MMQESSSIDSDEPANGTRATSMQRSVALDALRGFDMFWLIGGTGLASAIVDLCGPTVRSVLGPQLDHRPWEGCTFYDVIFPLFVFLVGMSAVFSMDRLKTEGCCWKVYRRILRRFVMMFALGLIYYGGLRNPLPGVRVFGVLQRLAVCYLFAALLYYHFRPRTLAAIAATILIGYWILFSFVPVPGTNVTGTAQEMNWARYIDEQYLPGAKHEGTWDANGIMSTFPAVGTCLLGVFAAKLLKSGRHSQTRKVVYFLGGGLALAVLGWVWGFQFPVIKKLWTSSYVLVTGGYSLMFLGVFCLIIDVWGFQWWTQPLVWIGANPLTIYMARNFADFNAFADRFVGGSVAAAVTPEVAYLFHTAVSFALSMALVWFLYRKRIFLRL
jgi:predicted acyltransferase